MTRARVLVAALVLTIGGCGWKVTPPESGPPGSVHKVGSRVVLKFDEASVAWGGGHGGEIVRDALQKLGVFDEVAYPVEPRRPTPLRLTVVATGNVDEEEALGTVKAFVIGFFLFVPAGVIRFGKTFDLDATVTFTDGERELRRFEVQTKTRVSHTMFSHSDQYEPVARRAAFEDLAHRIAVELGSLPGVPEPPEA